MNASDLGGRLRNPHPFEILAEMETKAIIASIARIRDANEKPDNSGGTETGPSSLAP